MSWDWEIRLLKLIKGPNRETVYHRYYCLLVLLRAFLLLHWFKNISLKSFVIHTRRTLEDLECIDVTIKYFHSSFMISRRRLLDTLQKD